MKRNFEILGLCIAWFAILAQFVLMIQNRQAEMLETILRFFGFFTILTNILVALFFTVAAFNIVRPPFKVLMTKGSITALTAFILIVGLVYQIVLRSIWEPTGLQYVVDELLHSVIPLYMLGYWIFNVEKEDLPLKKVLNWLLYPLIYIVFVIARGSLSEFYPYPFLNIHEIGFEKTLGNIAIIFVLALVILVTLSWGGKIIIKNRSVK